MASLAGLAYAVFWREPRPIVQPLVAADRVAPAEVAPAAARQPSPTIQRPAPEPEAPPAPPPALVERPAVGEAPPTRAETPSQTPAPTVTRLININTATAAELELLPGIGPALAGRIIDYRTKHGPFKAVEELDHVSGIGPRTLAKIRPVATVK